MLNTSLQYKPDVRRSIRAVVLCLATLTAVNGQSALDAFTAGKEFLEQGQPGKAVERFRQAVRALDGSTDQTLLVSALNGLGVAYTRVGIFNEAESVLKRVLAVCCSDPQAADPALPFYVNNLAEVYRATGRWSEAERTYRRGLRISAGKPIDEAASTLAANLGLLYHMQHKPGRAEPLLTKALAYFEGRSHPDHQKIVHMLNNVCAVQNALNRAELARTYCERALAIAEQHLGGAHPSTAATLNNLAGLLEQSGELGRAEELYRRALDLWTASLGDEHPSVGQALGNLATIAVRGGRHAEARELYDRAVLILTKSYGVEHPTTIRTTADFARLLRQTGRKTEAAALERSVKGLRERHQRENLGAGTVDVSDLLRRR